MSLSRAEVIREKVNKINVDSGGLCGDMVMVFGTTEEKYEPLCLDIWSLAGIALSISYHSANLFSVISS
jgi:hypothetical protein